MSRRIRASLGALLLGLSAMIALAPGAQAQVLRASDNPYCDWEIRGVIAPGLVERVEEKAVDWPPQVLLCLDSPGGNLPEGVRLFERLFASDVITVIPPGWRCESACAIAFMAGGVEAGSLAVHSTQRVLYPGGRLGFHAPGLGLPEAGPFSGEQVTTAFNSAVAAAESIVRVSQIEYQGSTPLNGFLLRRILGTPPDDMAMIGTIAEAALAEIQITGLPGPGRLDEAAAENACDLAITLHRHGYRRGEVDLAGLLEELSDLRQWRRDTEDAEIRTGTRRQYGETVEHALVTHYETDVARHMLACEITLRPAPDAMPNTRHAFENASQRTAVIRLRDHRWGFRFGEDTAYGEDEEVAAFPVPAWFMHPPETPLARFAPPPDAPVLLLSTDLPGDDLTRRGIRDVSLEGCIQACRERRGCQAFSYVEDRRWCWPKSRAPAPAFSHDVISGIMPGTPWPRD